MSPYALENLYDHLHRPAWFWPLIWAILLAMFMAGSMEGGGA